MKPKHDPTAQGFEPNDMRTHTFITHIDGWDLYWFEDRSMIYCLWESNFNKIYLKRRGVFPHWAYDQPTPSNEVVKFLRSYVALHA